MSYHEIHYLHIHKYLDWNEDEIKSLKEGQKSLKNLSRDKTLVINNFVALQI